MKGGLRIEKMKPNTSLFTFLGRYFARADKSQTLRLEPPLSDRLSSFVSEGKVLDIGCGRGWFMSKLSKGYEEVFGVDISLPRLKEASRYGAVVMASADALPFRANSFEIVTALTVLHHVETPWHVINEIRRVLRDDGIIYITESVEDNPAFSLMRKAYPCWDGDPVKARFRRLHLKRALTESGFRILLEETWGGNIYWLWRIIANRFHFLRKLSPLIIFMENKVNKRFKKFSCSYQIIARKVERPEFYM